MKQQHKNQPFFTRFKYALHGWSLAFRTEASFRTQSLFGSAALGLLMVLRPATQWWALFIGIIAAVLAAELFNSALEATLDLVEPKEHPLVAKAKDCAAGAVLILSVAALGILAAFVCSYF